MYNDKNIKDRQNMQQWKQINATPLLRVHAKQLNRFSFRVSNEDILIGEKSVSSSFWGYCGFEFLERWA